MARTLRFILCALLALVSGLRAETNARPPLTAAPHFARVAEAFAGQFPAMHVSGLALDDVVSARAWTNYIASLDPERVYFTAPDIERFRAFERELDDRLRRGDTAFAFGVFEVFLRRVTDRCAYTAALLEKGFDLTPKESYVWKRKDLPWPADEAAWNELWRLRIKNQYARLVVARETGDPLAEAGDEGQPAPRPEGPAAGQGTNAVRRAPSPEEMIRKQHEQLRILLEDSDPEWVLQRYLSSFAQAYDPHSEFLSPSSAENFNIEMKLSLEGIGALLRAEDGMARIEEIIPGGPADRDRRDIRLRPGDKIIAVGQENEEPVDVLHWPLQKVVARIRGPKGTKVVLVVIPASDPTGVTTKRVDLERDRVKLEERAAKGETREVKTADGAVRKLAVITVPAFYANVDARHRSSPEYRSSADDVRRILSQVETQRVEGVLLDLRTNGGGYLPEAVKMAGLFIRAGPVVQVKDREATRVWRDSDTLLAYAGPLVVLVNRLSASASEIVAGALQDYGRAVVVGDRKTHGKGTVQRLGPLGEDARMGSVKVTNASYYRVSGGSTQLKGVVPDVVVPSLFDGMEYGEDFLSNPMPWSSITPVEHPVADLGAAIPALRRQSEQRRAQNPRFASYRRLVEQTEAMSKRTELPLNIDERRALARQEKDLIDLQNRLIAAEGGGAEKDREKDRKNGDLVLDEALNVLSDLAALRPAPATQGDGGSGRSIVDTIMDIFGEP